MATKRKLTDESGTCGGFEGVTSTLSGNQTKRTAVSTGSSLEYEKTVGSDINTRRALNASRAALMKCPFSCRAAFTKHRASIDPALAKALDTVGSYEIEDGSTPLHEAARQEDVATVQALIMSGADVGIKDKNGATPLDLATPDSACRDFLEHHATAFATIDANERELLTAAFIHYGTFSELKDCMPPERLSLRPCHFDPSFVWAPPAARAAVFGYTQSATTIEPFADLPDDCAGDVLDFFDMILPRWIMLFLVTHYSSPGANAWIFEVLTAAIADNATEQLVPAAERGDLATVQDCLNRGADIDGQSSESDCTAIILASHRGCADVVKLLLEAGANIEAKDIALGFSPLHLASAKGHSDIIKLLLEAGADVEAKNVFGETVVAFAQGFGRSEVVTVLQALQGDGLGSHTQEGT